MKQWNDLPRLSAMVVPSALLTIAESRQCSTVSLFLFDKNKNIYTYIFKRVEYITTVNMKQGILTYIYFLFINQMNNTTTTRVIKLIKKIDKGYIVRECILTDEWMKGYKKREWNYTKEGIQSKLFPYDANKWIETVEKKYVEDYTQYFKKSLD